MRVLLGHPHRRQALVVVRVDQRDLLPDVDRCSATLRPADSVIGIGQNRPPAVRMPSHTPRQSACDMKPSSGVKPPMPSIRMSPRSRELTRTGGKAAARAAFSRELDALEQQRSQLGGAVRTDQIAHWHPPTWQIKLDPCCP